MLLDKALEEYLREAETTMNKILRDFYVERYEEEILTPSRVNLRIRIRFYSEKLLEINEALITQEKQIIHLGYRYHFQDRKNVLIFRYDNTPHFPDIRTFPSHKHTPNGVIESDIPKLSDIFMEVMSE